jgi:hypothetical protein
MLFWSVAPAWLAIKGAITVRRLALRAGHVLLKQQFRAFAADRLPSCNPVETLSSRARISRQLHTRETSFFQNHAGTSEKEAADAAAFKGLIDEQGPDTAVSWVGRGKPHHLGILLPEKCRDWR